MTPEKETPPAVGSSEGGNGPGQERDSAALAQTQAERTPATAADAAWLQVPADLHQRLPPQALAVWLSVRRYDWIGAPRRAGCKRSVEDLAKESNLSRPRWFVWWRWLVEHGYARAESGRKGRRRYVFEQPSSQPDEVSADAADTYSVGQAIEGVSEVSAVAAEMPCLHAIENATHTVSESQHRSRSGEVDPDLAHLSAPDSDQPTRVSFFSSPDGRQPPPGDLRTLTPTASGDSTRARDPRPIAREPAELQSAADPAPVAEKKLAQDDQGDQEPSGAELQPAACEVSAVTAETHPTPPPAAADPSGPQMTRDQARAFLSPFAGMTIAHVVVCLGMPEREGERFIRELQRIADPAPPRPPMTPAEARAELDRITKVRSASRALDCSLKHAKRHLEWLRNLARSDRPRINDELSALMRSR